LIRYVIGATAFLIGTVAAMQPPINAALARHGGPYIAATVSFLVGTLALLGVTLLSGSSGAGQIRSAPLWQYSGGLIGAVFVFGTIVLVPRLGATGLIAGIIGGQLAGSVLIDHFGLFGLPHVPPSPTRLLGLALLVVGGILVVHR
jgi:bacterial/archaeal transporter family-2 protein